MNISELLTRKRVTVSCELFPPKNGAPLENAFEIVEHTAALSPDFVSVTCSASGQTNNLAIVDHVKKSGAEPLAHLTCAAETKREIETRLDALAAAGVQNVLALRGDLPEGVSAPGLDSFRYANELVERIRRRGGFSIGAACYPEGHVECRSQELDLHHLKAKVSAGAEFLITQMFFDNDTLYRFMYKALARGIDVPVIAGIMPVTSRKQITRILSLSGTTLPPRFINMLDRFGDSDAAMRQAGVAYATEQIIDLIANGVRGVHIYTMNRPEIAGEIMRNISYIVEAGCDVRVYSQNVC